MKRARRPDIGRPLANKFSTRIQRGTRCQSTEPHTFYLISWLSGNLQLLATEGSVQHIHRNAKTSLVMVQCTG